MISILGRYLLRQLCGATLVILLVLSAAIWLTQSLRFVDWIVNRGLPVGTFLSIALLVMPSFLTVILPIALFAAVLFTYNKLQGDSELVVMRAVGAGPRLLVTPALTVAGVAMIIMYALNLYVLPVSYREFKDLQLDIRNNYSNVLVQEGVFSEIDSGLMMYVREQGPNGELFGIMVQDERARHKTQTWVAESGNIINGVDGPRLVMLKGNLQEMNRDDGKVTFLFFDSHTVGLTKLAEQVKELRQRDTTERFVGDLLAPTDVTDPVALNRFFAEGHQRLAGPLAVPAFTLVALAAMLSGEFSRRGQTRQILLAALIVIALQSLALGFANLTARNPLLMPLLYLVHLVPIGLATARLTRRTRPIPARAPTLDDGATMATS